MTHVSQLLTLFLAIIGIARPVSVTMLFYLAPVPDLGHSTTVESHDVSLSNQLDLEYRGTAFSPRIYNTDILPLIKRARAKSDKHPRRHSKISAIPFCQHHLIITIMTVCITSRSAKSSI